MLKAEQMRRDRGLTITALAIASGLSDVVVSKVMRGALPPWPKYRNALARALEWTGEPLELFEEIGDDDSREAEIARLRARLALLEGGQDA
jgi:transcriptional regulator with XRE-family HTH domain